VEKITSGGTPELVVCRRCYGNDQMKEDDMDDTYSMHGIDD
jgi:protein-arginine kinase activator protein McsA